MNCRRRAASTIPSFAQDSASTRVLSWGWRTRPTRERYSTTSRFYHSVANWPIFGCITQKGRIKSIAAGQSFGRILADFVQKGPNFTNFIKISFSLIFSNSLCKSKIVNFPRHLDTDNKIFISVNAFKISNLVGSRIFFSAAEFFPRTSQKSFAKS